MRRARRKSQDGHCFLGVDLTLFISDFGRRPHYLPRRRALPSAARGASLGGGLITKYLGTVAASLPIEAGQ